MSITSVLVYLTVTNLFLFHCWYCIPYVTENVLSQYTIYFEIQEVRGSILIIQHPIFLKKSPCMSYFVKIEVFLSLTVIDILQMFLEVPS